MGEEEEEEDREGEGGPAQAHEGQGSEVVHEDFNFFLTDSFQKPLERQVDEMRRLDCVERKGKATITVMGRRKEIDVKKESMNRKEERFNLGGRRVRADFGPAATRPRDGAPAPTMPPDTAPTAATLPAAAPPATTLPAAAQAAAVPAAPAAARPEDRPLLLHPGESPPRPVSPVFPQDD